MSLFRLDASIRVDGSHSRAIADIVEQEWRAGHPTSPVTRRHIGTDPVPATTWGIAAQAAGTPEDERSPAQLEAVAAAGREADLIVDADAALFAVPLYNFGVSQHFKTWVDLVITDPRMGPGGDPASAGKPAVLVAVRGGSYADGTPREGWDHATGWMRRILEDVWRFDLRVVDLEFTLVGVNPALDAFKDVAVELRSKAEQVAREHGRNLDVAPAN